MCNSGSGGSPSLERTSLLVHLRSVIPTRGTNCPGDESATQVVFLRPDRPSPFPFHRAYFSPPLTPDRFLHPPHKKPRRHKLLTLFYVPSASLLLTLIPGKRIEHQHGDIPEAFPKSRFADGPRKHLAGKYCNLLAMESEFRRFSTLYSPAPLGFPLVNHTRKGVFCPGVESILAKSTSSISSRKVHRGRRICSKAVELWNWLQPPSLFERTPLFPQQRTQSDFYLILPLLMNCSEPNN